ncbi:Flp pilus assembly complex ATPase component TadA [bacterium]|nr:Flp pilus assembly complex ATPase component TadA [bacterium]
MNVEELFTSMVERRASHLHLVPGSPILMRIDNQLVSMDGPVLSPQDTQAFSEAIMTEDLLDELEDRLECDFAFSVPGLSRFRVNVFRQRGSLACIVSTNPPSAPTLEELGIPELIRKQVDESSSGLVLVCGPKQSGKSSTVAALVDYILKTRCCQVVSIEDPLDFLHRNDKGVICQREIGTDVDSYKDAFASLSRQGADVVVVSNMESYEVTQQVLNLAATGTLVIAMANAPSVQVMLEKMIDTYPPHLSQSCRNAMALGIKAIVGQLLLRKASGDGLIPAFELLVSTGKLKELLRGNKLDQIPSYMAASSRDIGMQTQEMALRFLVRKNMVTMEEATSHSSRPEDFKKMMSLPY